MTRNAAFLGSAELLQIHRRMLEDFGGEPGLRDRGLLESAAAMPAARFGGRLLHRGVPAMAAAYLFHICRNHPFVDGNERTALAAAEIFLLLNARELAATDAQLRELTEGVASGRTEKSEVVRFFKRHGVRMRR